MFEALALVIAGVGGHVARVGGEAAGQVGGHVGGHVSGLDLGQPRLRHHLHTLAARHGLLRAGRGATVL